MAERAIEVGDLWKRYASAVGGHSLKSAVVSRLLGRPGPPEQPWALRGVSFAVQPGTSLAVIGPNGSGKTTLLGLLSRVLEPTQGTITVRGRVCVLLEAAVAFHPDLTGIENVLLQGMVLGMGRKEALSRLDGIIEFAEAAPYIDAPVRTYSLGQRARLGFAVASHMSPDVFLIDEVLAIVDEEFHYACYDRIRELRNGGCAIVFVSHILDQVRALCERTIWLDQGHVVADGATDEVLPRYEAHSAEHHRPS
jgi:ABC-type polysaccharide/polyol phosphate transport system ATPase subunit